MSKLFYISIVAARALATYLIPGCVGRGVRLGSESFFGGGIWKSGNHDSKKVLPGGPKKMPMTPKNVCLGVQKIYPLLKKNACGSQKDAHDSPQKMAYGVPKITHDSKKQNICLFPLVGQWALFTRFGPLLLSTWGGEIGNNCPYSSIEIDSAW